MVGTTNKSIAAMSEGGSQEGAPSLTWWSTPLDHVFGNARLRHLKPEFEQFAVDARCAPQRVVNAHLPDQCTQVCLFAAALPVSAISSANSSKSRPNANAPASQKG